MKNKTINFFTSTLVFILIIIPILSFAQTSTNIVKKSPGLYLSESDLGEVRILNTDPRSLKLRFEYGKNSFNMRSNRLYINPRGIGFGTFTGLLPGYTYQYRVVDVNGVLAPSATETFSYLKNSNDSGSRDYAYGGYSFAPQIPPPILGYCTFKTGEISGGYIQEDCVAVNGTWSLIAPPTSFCVFKSGEVSAGYTEAQCTKAGGTLNQTAPTTGYCTFPPPSGETSAGYTKIQCDLTKGTWNQNPPSRPSDTTVIPVNVLSGTPINPPSTPTSTTPTTAEASAGLVPPCRKIAATQTTVEQCVWGLPELGTLINNVLDFVLKKLALPIAAIMFAYAGFLLVTAGGEAAHARTKAKEIFMNVAIGLVFVAGAWLIVKTLLSILGYKYGAFIGF